MTQRMPTRMATAIVAGALLLSACGGGSAATPSTTPEAAVATLPSANTNAPTTAPTTAPATTAPTQTPTTAPVASGKAALLAMGKLIYTETAAGVGCQYCHGADGLGKGAAGLSAANIQGKNAIAVRDALTNTQNMADIKLTDEEIEAVALYLSTLK